jgi:hypothetical protein
MTNLLHEPSLQNPFTLVLGGPTGSGKTEFVTKLLIYYQTKIKPVPVKITYYFSEYQAAYDELKVIVPFIEFKEGLPSIEASIRINQLIILDDLMMETKDNEDILAIFTRKSHHRKISIILLTQNIFCKGSCMRSMSLNAHYIVCFNNPRDRSQIKYLARQINPSYPRYIEDAFIDATTQRPYSYILFDLKQTTPEKMRILGNFFEEHNEPLHVYVRVNS